MTDQELAIIRLEAKLKALKAQIAEAKQAAQKIEQEIAQLSK